MGAEASCVFMIPTLSTSRFATGFLVPPEKGNISDLLLNGPDCPLNEADPWLNFGRGKCREKGGMGHPTDGVSLHTPESVLTPEYD